MSAGLIAAGWECIYSADLDPVAVDMHRRWCATVNTIDITTSKMREVPEHDVLVAGFPCQPFSSSGTRSGFGHKRGHVFDSVAAFIEARKPSAVLLENVRGIISNANGHTFGRVIQRLVGLGYQVGWAQINSVQFGVPHSRPRIFLLGLLGNDGGNNESIKDILNGSTPAAILAQLTGNISAPKTVELDFEIESRRPRIGMAKPTPQTPFSSFGYADGAQCKTFQKVGSREFKAPEGLSDIVAPEFGRADQIRSVRYWGHSGETKPYFKREPIAHCLGTNIGAGPTFGVSLELIRSKQHRSQILRYANWWREDSGQLIFRLTPDRAVKLFGPYTEDIRRALSEVKAGDTKKYELLGNMVVPLVAKRLAMVIDGWFQKSRGPLGPGALPEDDA